MKPLTIERVKGQKKDYTFLGWKDDGLAFYATASDGQPAVIAPVSAYPADCTTGEPYRFPRMIPLGITPKQFNIAWSDHHREVLKRWRKTKLAEVDSETQETLFPFDALNNPRPVRSLEAINSRRREIKDGIEHRFKELMETPLVELLDPIAFPYLLEDFQRGRWADEMGEEFGVKMNEAGKFNNRWHDAYDPHGQHTYPQAMINALRCVRFVMRGDDHEDYPLMGVDVRMPTDQEAKAHALLQQLLGVKSDTEGHRRITKRLDKPKPRARLEKDFSLAVIPQPKGDPLPVAIEQELQTLLKRIIEAGGRIPRTALRKGKGDTFQPEKLLRSNAAKAIMNAGLLGKAPNGRTTVYWAKVQAD